MSVIFDYGDGSGGWIKGSEGWIAGQPVDKLKFETLARRLILSASRCIPKDNSHGLIFWCMAGAGGPGVLKVTKGLHQKEATGPFRHLTHLTMRLYDINSREGDLTRNTNFPGQFHLYARCIDPDPVANWHRLQPTRLSYELAGRDKVLDTASVPPTVISVKPSSSRSKVKPSFMWRFLTPTKLRAISAGKLDALLPD